MTVAEIEVLKVICILVMGVTACVCCTAIVIASKCIKNRR